MRVLWLCNLMPAAVARVLKKNASNKEGWIAGSLDALLARRGDDDIELCIAFPVKQDELLHGEADGFKYFGFLEDTDHPEEYDPALQASLGLICEEVHPDVIHVFGTEFPHCLAMLRLPEWRSRVIVHLQGIMERCAEVYCGDLPEEVINKATFRDVLRHDSIKQQKEKYERRAEHEIESLSLAARVCGRTAFDKACYLSVHPSGTYYSMNETLRSCFYEGSWSAEECTLHRIIVPQGNIPLKGVHVMLKALALLKERYPDVQLIVCGDNVLRGGGPVNAIKRSAYGSYLKKLITDHELHDAVSFVGSKRAEEMKELYLSAHVFVLPSFIENSPNSLGEAMLLGLPCIASRVGGIPSLAKEGEEVRYVEPGDAKELAAAVREIFEYPGMAAGLAAAGKKRAVLTFDREANYRMLRWIYGEIVKENT